MPISIGIERLVIFCMRNLLAEAHIFDEIDRVPSIIDFEEAYVCDMTVISDAITNFFNIAFSCQQSVNIEESEP